jgi:transposase-like protein
MGRRANEALALAWERRIARQRRSRLSVNAFCAQEGVSPQSFYAWRRRLGKPLATSPPAPLFIPMEVPQAVMPGAMIRVDLPGGAVLTLSADSTPQLVMAVIRALLSEAAPAAEPPAC